MAGMKEVNFGCVQSPPDERDFITTAVVPQDTKLSVKVSYRPDAKYVRALGMLGTCVGFGGMATKNIHEHRDDNLPDEGLSPLFLYSRCKQLDGIPNIEGTYVRVAMKVLHQDGIVPEKDMPYTEVLLNKRWPKITGETLLLAMPYKIDSYAQVPRGNVDAARRALAEQGPLMASVMVTMSLITPDGGKYIAPMEGTQYGLHCIAIIGYDDEMTAMVKGKQYTGFFEVQNSYGTSWADGGFAYMPYDVFADTSFIYEVWSSVDYINKQDKPKYHRVQLGAFRVKSNAENYAVKLKAAGYPIYIVTIGDLYKVQTGAFSIKANADRLRDELKSKGFDAFITYY